MERLNKQIELAKDAFIIYCYTRFKDDSAIHDMITDIQYLEHKKTQFINSKKLRLWKK